MYRLVFVARRRKRGFGFILRKKESGPVYEREEDEGERKRSEWVDGGSGKEAAHFSCLTAERGKRENPERIFHGECKFGLKYHGKM